jgi:hypothetical protein
MSIRVIGAGMGRTGTLSLKNALEQLGFSKCYHMVDVLAHPDHARVWDAAARGEPVDWEALFRGYQATIDWPGCSLYHELMRVYPEAKVILTVREPDRWYASALQTIYYARHAFPGWSRLLAPRMRDFTRMLDRLVWQGTFQGRFEDKEFSQAIFQAHNDEVRRTVPAEKLLVFDVREGWEPLCHFLAAPVPSGVPFPQVNDTAEFRQRIARGVRFVRVIGAAAVVLLVVVTVWLARLLRS